MLWTNGSLSVGDADKCLALGAAALLLIVGVSRRSAVWACLAASSRPLLYRGLTSATARFETRTMRASRSSLHPATASCEQLA